ncbi:Plant methyltransferase dimerization [Dillenia turbinata]|uniref:Plant methyltransferase dimerization n=1 Tax=Dillenia turbinata TaxID=194707 RepID=A0AAN8VY75_9MAGN
MSVQADEEVEVGKLAVRLANAVVMPMVLKSALELGVIDIISSAPETYLSPSEISGRISAKNPDAPVLLDRMLALLASHGILKCELKAGEDGEPKRVYGASPICKFLTRKDDGSGSVAPLFLLHHDKVFLESWYHLNDAVLESGVPFDRAYGMNAFEYPGIDPRFNRVFNQAMSNHTTLILKKILNIYAGFEGLKVLVDVGGGIGVTLNIITTQYPHIKGINFDLPHVLSDAPSYPGVEHVGGDMFKSVPSGDAIFMKWILHDWSDDHCLKLLKNCYKALPNNGKVIIVESLRPVIPDNNVTSNIVHEQDLFMLAQNPGGKERTQQEYEALGVKAGFSSLKVICCAYNSWVMEFHKV